MFVLWLLGVSVVLASVFASAADNKSTSSAPSWQAVTDSIFSQPLQPDGLRQDVQFVFTSVEEIHPSPHAYAKKSDVVAAREALLARINRHMTRSEFYKLLAPAVASFKSGHTIAVPFMNEFSRYVGSGGTVLPLSLRQVGDVLLVADGWPDGPPPGSQVLMIGSEDARTVWDRLARRMPGEGVDACPCQLERPKVLCMAMWVEYGPVKELEVKARLKDGTVRLYAVKSVTWQQFTARLSRAETGNSYRHLSEQDAVLISLNEWPEDAEKHQEFLRDAFTQVRDKHASSVIIDVRRNPGGNSERARALLEFLTDKPFRLFEEVGLKLSRQYIAQHEKELGGSVPADRIGSIRTQGIPPVQSPSAQPLRSAGRVYVLMGPASNSTTTDFLAVVQHFGLGTLVGQPTTDTRRAYGDTFEVALPYSGLKLHIACKYFLSAGGREDGGPVRPDRLVETTVEDVGKGADPVMQLTLDLIDAERKKEPPAR